MYNVLKSGREALVHMPKKIAELREKMIAYARQALLQEGTSALLVLAADPEKHFENVRPIFARLL